MTVFHQVSKDLSDIVESVFHLKLEKVGLSFASEHGELSTNISFVLGKLLLKNHFDV